MKYYMLPSVLSAGAVVFAAYCLYTEASAFERPFSSDRTFIDTIAETPPNPGLSIYAQNAALRDCDFALRARRFDLQAKIRFRSVARSCSKTAEAIIATTPVQSYAWVIRARAAAALKDTAILNKSLQMSEMTAPVETWLALPRADIAEANESALEPATLAAYRADIAALVASRDGIARVADRYQKTPEARPLITAVVEGLPMLLQKNFLAAVNQAKARATRNNLPAAVTQPQVNGQ